MSEVISYIIFSDALIALDVDCSLFVNQQTDTDHDEPKSIYNANAFRCDSSNMIFHFANPISE